MNEYNNLHQNLQEATIKSRSKFPPIYFLDAFNDNIKGHDQGLESETFCILKKYVFIIYIN